MATYGPAGIAASADDMYPRSDTSGGLNETSSFMRVGESPTAAATFCIHMIFDGITILNGARITDAYIDFRTTTDSDGTAGTVLTTLSAHDTDDVASGSVTTWSQTDTARSNKTTAQITWDFTQVDANDNALQSPSMTSVIQEIVDRAGWASGNGVHIMWDDDGNTDRRQAVAQYDHSTYTEPQLTIQYQADLAATVASAATITAALQALSPTKMAGNFGTRIG